MINWNNDMSQAPRDGTVILGWCNHKSDPYHNGLCRLTIYAAHVEELCHASDGVNLVKWGGKYEDVGCGYIIPDWWFVADDDWETVANPTHWALITEPTNA